MFKRKAEDDGAAGKAFKFGAAADGDRKATFTRNLAALNSQFAAWVAEQAGSAPKELWTDGVEDYLKHSSQLLADFKDVLDGTPGASAPPQAGPAPTPPAAPAAAAPAAAAAAAGSSKPPLAPGGMFGAGGGSGTAAAAPPASIFGGLGGSAPPFGGNAFGGSGATSAANSGGSGLFNVPSTGTLGSSWNSGAATGGGEEEGEEGEEEQNAEPSVQVEAGEGTEMLAKQRVKLMSMTPEKKWKDKGKGTLTLRRATADAAGKQPYFVFTTDSGRVLINAPLVKGMKPTSNPKVPTAVIMFLISNVEGTEERAMHMFRCDSADAAKEMMATIGEHA